MSKFKNMKIAIVDSNHQKKVCNALEELGYKKHFLLYSGLLVARWICGCDDGSIMDLQNDPYWDAYEEKILEQLLNEQQAKTSN